MGAAKRAKPLSPRKAAAARAFGERLQSRRIELGFSQRELAKLSGVDNGLISRIEAGESRSPTAETVGRLARALGVSSAFLLEGKEESGRVVRPSDPLELLRRSLMAPAPAPLVEAIAKRGYGPLDLGVITLARVVASAGERHLVKGWIDRMEEFETALKQCLPDDLTPLPLPPGKDDGEEP